MSELETQQVSIQGIAGRDVFLNHDQPESEPRVGQTRFFIDVRCAHVWTSPMHVCQMGTQPIAKTCTNIGSKGDHLYKPCQQAVISWCLNGGPDWTANWKNGVCRIPGGDVAKKYHDICVTINTCPYHLSRFSIHHMYV